MISPQPSSRRRYAEYRKKRKSKGGGGAATATGDGAPEQKKRQRSFFTLFGEFWGLLKGVHGRIAFVLGTLSVSTLLALVPPASTKVLIDYVLVPQPLPDWWPAWAADRRLLLTVTAVSMITIACVSIAVGMTGRWQATRTTYRVKAAIRRRVFEHTMHLPLHRVQQLKAGGMASMLNEDTGTLSDLIFSMIYNPWRAIVQLVGSLVILGLVDWRLLVGSLLLIPCVYLTHRTWISRIRPVYRDIAHSRTQIDSQVTEAFGGSRVVRTFGRQAAEQSRYVRHNQFRTRQEMHVWWWARAVDIAWGLLIPVASAALLWYGGNNVLDGALTIGDLMMFLAYLVMLLGPLETLAVSATQFQSGLAGLDRVLDLLKEPRELPDQPDAAALPPGSVAGRISFRHVTFSYPGAGSNVLEDINLDVQPGRMIALVGPSGSGKTTLCNLVARFYDPAQGVIELDGRDIRSIRLADYRGLLGIVEQDIFLFDGTVAQNIAYARRGVDEAQIIRAARLANAHEFITRFEKGYDTIIGERGVRLSGGQRQRLAIARAILADPRILILDEATSNLDTESERLIQASLAMLLSGRTTFVIAHRLSTIVHADQIVVLERGRITEQGTHDELMARSGAYRRMVDLQTQPQALTAEAAVNSAS